MRLRPSRTSFRRASHQANGLVAWFPMLSPSVTWDAGRGTLASSVNGPTVSAVNREHGPGLRFDSNIGQYVNLWNPPELDIVGPITMSAWFRYDDTAGGGLSYILSGGYDGSNEAYVLSTQNSGADLVIACGSYDGAGHGTNTTITPSVGDIHLITAVYTGAAWQIYLDGVLKNSSTDAVGALTSSANVLIGAGEIGVGSPARYLMGTIWDARIYNRGLTGPEVAALYQPRSRWELYHEPRPWWLVNTPGEAAAGNAFNIFESPVFHSRIFQGAA